MRSVLIERQARHRRGTLGDAAQFLLVVAVPGEDGAVGSAGQEGSVDGYMASFTRWHVKAYFFFPVVFRLP